MINFLVSQLFINTNREKKTHDRKTFQLDYMDYKTQHKKFNTILFVVNVDHKHGRVDAYLLQKLSKKQCAK